MNFRLWSAMCLLGAISLGGTPAQASQYEVTVSSPAISVTGGVIIDKSATDFSIDSIVSSNLTILGHAYPVSDMLFTNNAKGAAQIYGKLNGNSLQGGTNDFAITWNLTTGAFIVLTGAVMGTPGDKVSTSGTITFTSLAAKSVATPIPAVGLPGLAIAFGGMVAWRRRRKATAA